MMDYKIFAEQLKRIAPSRADLASRNLPDDFIENFLDGYNCREKTFSTSRNILSNNALLNLVSNYDCSRVEIGIISFLAEIVEDPNFYHFGNAEQDILVLDKVFLNVNVVDPYEPTHVIWECASSGENFLAALLFCADFFSSRAKDISLVNNSYYTLERAHLCSEKAGGDEYLEFYKMMFGYSG